MGFRESKIVLNTKRMLNFLLGLVLKTRVNCHNRLAVLTYHNISMNESSDIYGICFRNFISHLSFFKRNIETLKTVHEFEDFFNFRDNLKEHRVKMALSFDDGFKSILKIVPIIEKLDILTFLFITPAFVNRSEKYLTWDELRFIKNALGDRVVVGSHGLTHSPLHLLNPDEVRKELVDSKAIIEDRLKLKVLFIAYPYGIDITDTMTEMAHEAGYVYGFTNRYGLNCPNGNKLKLKRIPVSRLDTSMTLKHKIYNEFNPHLLRYLFKEKRSICLK